MTEGSVNSSGHRNTELNSRRQEECKTLDGDIIEEEYGGDTHGGWGKDTAQDLGLVHFVENSCGSDIFGLDTSNGKNC